MPIRHNGCIADRHTCQSRGLTQTHLQVEPYGACLAADGKHAPSCPRAAPVVLNGGADVSREAHHTAVPPQLLRRALDGLKCWPWLGHRALAAY